MRKTRIALVAGAAVLALAGAAAMAADKHRAPHTTTSAVAGDQVLFTGDTRSIAVVDDPFAFEPFWFAPIAIERDQPFAMLERMTREMERETASMLVHAQALAAAPLADGDTVLQASFGNRPGRLSYSMVSTTAGGKSCTRSVQITATADGSKPQVIKNSSGDCDAVQTSWPGIDAPTTPEEAPLKVKWRVEEPKKDSTSL